MEKKFMKGLMITMAFFLTLGSGLALSTGPDEIIASGRWQWEAPPGWAGPPGSWTPGQY